MKESFQNRMIKRYRSFKPMFEPGGRFSALRSVYEGMESFLTVPATTSKSGVLIHDSVDTKRVMSIVVLALLPALLFGIYNVGYQTPYIPNHR